MTRPALVAPEGAVPDAPIRPRVYTRCRWCNAVLTGMERPHGFCSRACGEEYFCEDFNDRGRD